MSLGKQIGDAIVTTVIIFGIICIGVGGGIGYLASRYSSPKTAEETRAEMADVCRKSGGQWRRLATGDNYYCIYKMSPKETK